MKCIANDCREVSSYVILQPDWMDLSLTSTARTSCRGRSAIAGWYLLLSWQARDEHRTSVSHCDTVHHASGSAESDASSLQLTVFTTTGSQLSVRAIAYYMGWTVVALEQLLFLSRLKVVNPDPPVTRRADNEAICQDGVDRCRGDWLGQCEFLANRATRDRKRCRWVSRAPRTASLVLTCRLTFAHPAR